MNKLFGCLYDVVVPVEDWHSLHWNSLVRSTNDLGLDCVVLPHLQGVTEKSNGMILQSDEFLTIAKLAPWLFKKGVLIVFDEHQSRNNRLFEETHTMAFSKIQKILLGREDMMIFSQMRPLNEFLDCNYGALSQFQKE